MMSVPDPQVKMYLNELSSRYAIPRKKAIDALVKIGTPAVISLIKKLKDRNPDVQEAAAEALDRIGTRVAKAAVTGWRRERGEWEGQDEQAGV
jgi:HEAT repeat protein